MTLSDELRMLARPFATYRRARAERATDRGSWVFLRGPALFFLVLAAFVSWTTAGRLVGYHLVFAPLSWAWLPLWQLGWLWVVTRVFRTDRSFAQAVDLYYLGFGPWIFLLLGVSGLCLFVPEPSRVLVPLFSSGAGFALLLVAMLWGIFLTYACFVSGLGLGRWRALGATGLFYAGAVGSAVGYYFATDQLAPFLG